MLIDLSTQSARWAPSAPAAAVMLAVCPTGAEDSGADLTIEGRGVASVRGGASESTARPPGLLTATIPFHDGTARTVHIITSPITTDDGHTRSAQDALAARVESERGDSPGALILVLHPFARMLRDGSPGARQTFERRMVRAGADVLVSTRASSREHVDVVEGRPVIGGVSTERAMTVTIELRSDRSTVHAAVPSSSDPRDAFTDLLEHTHDPVAFLRAVDLTTNGLRGGVSIEMDAHHRAPAYMQRHGTALTRWEEDPEPLDLDWSVPAHRVMWERELRRRGATVNTLGRDLLAGIRPDGEALLVHAASAGLSGVPGTVAASDPRTRRRVLREAGIAAAGGPAASRGGAASGADADERVRITVVDGAARAALGTAAPILVGDGRRTVQDLVNDMNDDRWRDLHLHDALIALAPARLDRLRDAGLGPLSILPEGTEHALDSAPGTGAGADPVDVTETIHRSYVRIAESAAAAFPGLGAVGVEIRTADPRRSADTTAHAVTAVTGEPDIASHGGPVRGTPRNVVADAADALVAVTGGHRQVRRHRPPEQVATPTSGRLLAAELSARGFVVDWLAEDLFFAEGHGRTLAVRGAMTDRTSNAARTVLARPLLRRRMLESAGLPQPSARTFGHGARDRAWRHVCSFDAATVQFGADDPLDTHGMSKAEFDEAWRRSTQTIRAQRAAVARRSPGERVRFLVVHGRVLGIVREAGASRAGARPHRSYRRLAADAARTFAGADIAQVTLLIARPDAPATADSVVEHVRLDPDLVEFAGDGATGRDIVRTVVDLHLGSERPGREPAGVWSDDATSIAPRLRSAAWRASRRIIRRVRRRLAPGSTAVRHEHGGLRFEIADGSAEVIGATEPVSDLVVPGTVDGVPVTAVGAGSFRDSAGLRTVELPPTVRTIDAHAFHGCTGLRTVVLPTDLRRIGTRAFAGCRTLSTLHYFVATGPKKERIVRRNLVEPSIPWGVTDIGVGAFEGCASLEHVALPHRTTRVRESVLAGCASLRSVWLHNGIDQVDTRAFAGCTALESLRVPDALTSFPSDAFDAGTALVCADGSDVHGRALELGLAVDAQQASPPSIGSAWGAEDRETVRDVLGSAQRTREITTLYALRPAVDAVDRRDEDRRAPRRPPRFRREDGAYRSTAPVAPHADTTITMVGDLMCGASQQRSALQDGAYDFTESFEHVRDVLLESDLSLGNLETMVSPSHPLTAGALYVDARPHLNAPFAYLAALRDAGFDAVLNAQNHMYDTGALGVLETLDALNDAQLAHGGLYASADEDRFLLFSVNGMTIGVVAHLDPHRQRMKKSHFTRAGLDAMAGLLDSSRVRADIDAAKAAGAEFVLAYCHWGEEYTPTIAQRQSRYAQMVADAGADYVFGSHSHCPQHYTVLTAQDGRQVPVVYSGGNFLSHITRHRPITQDTFIASLTLTRDASGRVVMKSDGYMPCRIVPHRGIRGRVAVVPVDDLEQGALGYSPATAAADRERIANALGSRYRSRARTAFP